MECCEDEAVQGKGKRSFDAMEDVSSDPAQPCIEEQGSASKEDCACGKLLCTVILDFPFL